MHFSICDFILDIVQNSLEADADTVNLEIVTSVSSVRVAVRDNGNGMTKEECNRLTDPYYTDGKKHKKRPVGLGIPFLIQGVEQSGGTWDIDSTPGKGTTFMFSFPTQNVDTPPLGNVADLLLQVFLFEGDYEVIAVRRMEDVAGMNSYTVRRSECGEALGSIHEGISIQLLREFLNSLEENCIGEPIAKP